MYTVTIDGAQTKDFDDAISLLPLKTNKKGKYWKLFVHIADVSYYVKKNSPLDQEAKKRGTSYYLADGVLPMLPVLLSEKFCSLQKGKTRLTLSVEMTLFSSASESDSYSFHSAEERNSKKNKIKKDNKKNRGIEIIAFSFSRSIIKVDKRYTYDEVNTLLEGRGNKEFQNTRALSSGYSGRELLEELMLIAAQRKAKEFADGRLQLEIPEGSIEIAESGETKKISYAYKQDMAHSLVEEAMLSANSCAAKFTSERKIPSLYRVHEEIDQNKIDYLNQFCQTYRIPYKINSLNQKTLQGLLDRIKEGNKRNKDKQNLLYVAQNSILRALKQARYSPEALGHWALNFKNYCHFTSPIRRYPDLVVHRSIISKIKRSNRANNSSYAMTELEGIAISTSDAERKAISAERDILKIKVLKYFKAKNISQLRGTLSGIKNECLFFDLLDYPTDVMVQSTSLDLENFSLVDAFSVFIKPLGKVVRIGEIWPLLIKEINISKIFIECVPEWYNSKYTSKSNHSNYAAYPKTKIKKINNYKKT